MVHIIKPPGNVCSFSCLGVRSWQQYLEAIGVIVSSTEKLRMVVRESSVHLYFLVIKATSIWMIVNLFGLSSDVLYQLVSISSK